MAEPIQVDFAGKGRRQAPRKPAVIPPERAGLKVILSIIGSVLTAIIGYYVMLPPLNLRAQEFYLYLGMVAGSFILFLFLLSRASSQPEYTPYVKQKSLIPGIIIAVIVAFYAVAWVISSPFFQAKRYSELMPVKLDANFSQDVPEADFARIPRLDENAAKAVAKRTLGALADYVSQFTIAESSTLINYGSKPVRVVPLAYADLVKWLVNTRDGLPGYVIVDMANEQSRFVKLPERIRYSDQEHFGKLLKRHLRFQFPTYMFGVPTFQIKENEAGNDYGHPYWVAPRMDKRIGLLGGEDVIGIVLVDAVTGVCEEWSVEDLRTNPDLQWIDRVFNAQLLNTQYDYYGKYINGFWNSLLGQRDVKVTTADYNYLAQNDDVYMYTGVTSANTADDNSIIGFILVNQRTKDAVFYQMEGAKESSAQGVAEGLVSAYKWKATFPLLINVSSQPTYFLSLLDDSNVIQGYSMVNVDQYNKIKVWGDTLAKCTNNYLQALRENGIDVENIITPPPGTEEGPDITTPPVDGPGTVTGAVADIQSEVINGNTVYYIQLAGSELYYSITAAQAPGLVLLTKGQTVTIDFTAGPGNIQQAGAVVWKQAR